MSHRASHHPRLRRRAPIAVALLAAGAIITPAVAAHAADGAIDCSTVAWMDTSLSAEQRAQALLDASEQHQIYRWLSEQPANDPDRTNWNPANNGDGHPSDGQPVIFPAQVPCTPDVVYTNGPEGIHRTAGTTAWPAPVAQAATWNLELAVDKGASLADESFDKRRNVVLGPGINSARTPLSGRNSE